MADVTSSTARRMPTCDGINHLVINVRDIEESHKFWTEILGFKRGGADRNAATAMRFYSGDHDGQHESPRHRASGESEPAEAARGMEDVRKPVAINHIAITMPSREAWLKRLAWLRENGVKFRARDQSWPNPQPLHRRSQRLWRRSALRIAARGLG